MKYNSRSLLFLLISFLCLYGSALAQEKEKDCRPIRANRHKKLVAGHWSFLFTPLDDGPNKYTYERRYGSDVDTGLILKGDEIMYSFFLRGDEVANRWVRYETSGEQFVDSIDHQKSFHYNTYFGAFHSRNVVSTVNLTQNKYIYYGRRGNDSLVVYRSSAGIAKKIIRMNNNTGGETLEFSTDGILEKRTVDGRVFIYGADGILQSCRLDTGIRDHRLTCIRNYYSDGVIKSVTYFMEDTPAHVWLYYNAQGALVQSVKKKQLSSFVSNVYVEAPQPQRIYKYVEQYPDLPGGFDSYMLKKLPQALCESQGAVSGTYSVQFKVSKEGVCSLVKVSGQNVEAITPALNNLFAVMPRWRPGKMNGVATSSVWVFPIRVLPE